MNKHILQFFHTYRDDSVIFLFYLMWLTISVYPLISLNTLIMKIYHFGLFVFSYCITNYHKHIGLKQCTFIISQFPFSRNSSDKANCTLFSRSSRWLSGKESTCQGRRHRGCGLGPWVGTIPLEKGMATHSSFLPGESHGQKSLGGCNP